jgi:hypothetical protein
MGDAQDDSRGGRQAEGHRYEHSNVKRFHVDLRLGIWMDSNVFFSEREKENEKD